MLYRARRQRALRLPCTGGECCKLLGCRRGPRYTVAYVLYTQNNGARRESQRAHARCAIRGIRDDNDDEEDKARAASASCRLGCFCLKRGLGIERILNFELARSFERGDDDMMRGHSQFREFALMRDERERHTESKAAFPRCASGEDFCQAGLSFANLDKGALVDAIMVFR